ncbi:MAG: hypothetical protein M0C28_16200 [Candidatus Moduliflexus flocculans]|nr:hypothetical protein [Candidatus Moduliflexus flocculans]
MIPLEGMRQRLTAADAAGLQLCIHAIGDQAISIVLDLFADVRAGQRRARQAAADRARPACRLEGLRPLRRRRASSRPFSPTTPSTTGGGRRRRIGPARIADDVRVPHVPRQGRARGVRLGLAGGAARSASSAIYAAVTRATHRREAPGRLGSGSRRSRSRRLSAGYTAGSAYAEFAERRQGDPRARPRSPTSSSCPSDIFAVAPARIRGVDGQDDDRRRAGRVRAPR